MGDQETETQSDKHKAKVLTAEASTQQNMEDGWLLRRKNGSNHHKDTLEIPGVEDTETGKIVFFKTKGSNVLANVYCPHFIYFYDNMIYVYQFRMFPKIVICTETLQVLEKQNISFIF